MLAGLPGRELHHDGKSRKWIGPTDMGGTDCGWTGADFQRGGDGGRSLILSSTDQREFLLQILNEVCNGFRVDEFERTLGFSRDNARSVWSRLNDGGDISSLSSHEVSALRRATILTMNELEDGISEFQTRTGFEVEQAQSMIELLGKMEAGV